MNRLVDAVAYAAQVHDGQTRKSSDVPYMSHLLGVAAIVLEHGGSEDEAIAGLLHDTIEDQPTRTSIDEIRDRFGAEVARIVDACSETDKDLAWWTRKNDYLDHLARSDAAVCLVAAADKAHNLTSLRATLAEEGPGAWQRFNADRAHQFWYYGTAYRVFQDNMVPKGLLRRIHDDLVALLGGGTGELRWEPHRRLDDGRILHWFTANDDGERILLPTVKDPAAKSDLNHWLEESG